MIEILELRDSACLQKSSGSEAPEKPDRVWNTEGKRPEETREGIQRKRPFLENSTACQKSTPDMLIPRLLHGDEVP
ncbi:hypothetical protein, partial [Streptomyces sp. NPDC048650]|uniref:hypothetical protein n=1 Tax=unclassified Streptomyces TaxID=2593676 RepID=UPI00372147D1